MNQIEFYGRAIYALAPENEYHCTGGDTIGELYDSMLWINKSISKPTKAQVKAKCAELLKEYEAQAYARKREAEYPTWNEVNEAMAEKLEGRGEKWEAISQKRQAVRAKYPKG